VTPAEVIVPLLLRPGYDMWDFHYAEKLAAQIVDALEGRWQLVPEPFTTDAL
jgi:hypothetical protein